MKTTEINKSSYKWINRVITGSCFLLIAWLILFSSCKHDSNPSKKAHTSFNKDSSVEIKLRPVQLDETKEYLFNTINETRIVQEVNDEEMVVENAIEVSTLYRISKDSSGNYIFNISFKDFKVKVKAGDIEKDLKATTAAGSFDPQERIFAAFNNAVVVVKVDTSGKVLAVDSLDRIQAKMYELAKGNADATQMIKTSLQQYLTADNFKNIFENTYKILPQGKIKPGYQWKVNNTAVADMKIDVPLQYILEGIEDNNAVVSVAGRLDFENKQIQVQANTIDYSLKGEQSGEIKIDLSTGLVSSSESEFNAKGKMNVMGKEIPVKMMVKNSVRSQVVK